MSSNELEVLEHYNRKIQKYLDVQNAEEVLLKWVKISLTQYRRWKLPHQSCYIIIVPEMIHITPSWLTSSTNTHLLSDFNTYLTTFNHLRFILHRCLAKLDHVRVNIALLQVKFYYHFYFTFLKKHLSTPLLFYRPQEWGGLSAHSRRSSLTQRCANQEAIRAESVETSLSDWESFKRPCC